jgi:hypothetical protein
MSASNNLLKNLKEVRNPDVCLVLCARRRHSFISIVELWFKLIGIRGTA